MNVSIVHFPVIDSTNIYTTGLLSQSGIPEWTVIMADSQTGGKGQRGKTWDSEYGKNLLCSVVVFPLFLQMHEQFMVSAAVSLAVCKTLSSFQIEAQIKWPNDIMVKGKKIAGLLIENQLSDRSIDSSVIGIGLNINQVDFCNSYAWPATSMKASLGAVSDISRDEVLLDILKNLHTFLEKCKVGHIALCTAYNELLLFKGEQVVFTHAGNKTEGKLKGVTLLGEIVIQTEQGDHKFVNGEVSLLNTFAV